MDHVAIDLGSRESQICRRESSGKIVEERRLPTAALEIYLKALAPSCVIVETCAEAFRVADEAKQAGHTVKVVPSTLSQMLGVGARGVKTDLRDARAVSEASCRIDLPSVHIPSQASRDHKTMCGMRDALVSSRTQLVNTVRGWMRGQSIQLRPGAPETLSKRLRARAGRMKLELPSCVERQLKSINSLSEQIGEADAELSQLAKTDPICQRLMTVPGIGPLNAILYTAVIDEVERFPTARKTESYLGLTPGEDSSSTRTRRTAITKAGSPRMRRLLVQAAHVARRWRPEDPMVIWSMAVEKRRGKQIAATALARKLAGILYAIWRDSSVYEPQRGAAPTEPDTSIDDALALLSKPRLSVPA